MQPTHAKYTPYGAGFSYYSGKARSYLLPCSFFPHSNGLWVHDTHDLDVAEGDRRNRQVPSFHLANILSKCIVIYLKDFWQRTWGLHSRCTISCIAWIACSG